VSAIIVDVLLKQFMITIEQLFNRQVSDE